MPRRRLRLDRSNKIVFNTITREQHDCYAIETLTMHQTGAWHSTLFVLKTMLYSSVQRLTAPTRSLSKRRELHGDFAEVRSSQKHEQQHKLFWSVTLTARKPFCDTPWQGKEIEPLRSYSHWQCGDDISFQDTKVQSLVLPSLAQCCRRFVLCVLQQFARHRARFLCAVQTCTSVQYD